MYSDNRKVIFSYLGLYLHACKSKSHLLTPHTRRLPCDASDGRHVRPAVMVAWQSCRANCMRFHYLFIFFNKALTTRWTLYEQQIVISCWRTPKRTICTYRINFVRIAEGGPLWGKELLLFQIHSRWYFLISIGNILI